MADIFYGWVVFNKKRRSVVLDHDTEAFVWDSQEAAEAHKREDEGADDELRYVQIYFVD